MKNYCEPYIKSYDEEVLSLTDPALEEHLFRHYSTLTNYQRAQPDYRKWRRCIVREGLRRGLLTKDPGLGPIERS